MKQLFLPDNSVNKFFLTSHPQDGRLEMDHYPNVNL